MGTEDGTPAAADAESVAAVQKIEGAIGSGANWFYWIAGLSVVNSVMHLFGSDRSFIVGLGITQVIDAIAAGGASSAGASAGNVLRAIALFLDFMMAAFFVLLGWQAGKKRAWAFVLGMILYALDGLIFVLIRDWLSIGFHVFALFGVWAGYSALRKLRTMEMQAGLRPIGPSGV